MRIRSIKPSFWRSDDITALPMDVRLLFIGLWSYVDDNGVGLDDYRQIAADLFALEEDHAAIRQFVREGLATLSRGLLVVRYVVADKPYLFITGWDRHQKVDRPTKPRYPRPSGGDNPSDVQKDDSSRGSREDASSPRSARAFIGEGEKGRRGEGEKGKNLVPRNPRGTRIPDDFAVTEVMADWGREHAPNVQWRYETAQFIDYWQAKAGKDAIKLDWVRTWRTWMRRAEKESGRRGRQNKPSTTDQRVQAGLDLAAELRAESEQRAVAALVPASPPELRIAGGEQ